MMYKTDGVCSKNERWENGTEKCALSDKFN